MAWWAGQAIHFILLYEHSHHSRSRHVGPIKVRVEEWGKQLSLFSETMVSIVYVCACVCIRAATQPGEGKGGGGGVGGDMPHFRAGYSVVCL